MPTIPFVWTNDDITFGDAERLQKQVDFLNRFRIPGSFFVIPMGQKGITEDVALLRVIESARSGGHEFYQHGFVHTPFESGVPPTWMLDFSPDLRRHYDDDRLAIDAQHTVEKLTGMIAAGRAIWRNAFHEDSPGYRPGWGAICNNLYIALHALGFQWISSRIPSRTSWLRNFGQWNAPLEYAKEIPALPHMLHGLVEYPLGSDYAFDVPNDETKITNMVELAAEELQHYHACGYPLIIVSHPQGLERNGGTGYRIHERILTQFLAGGKVEPMAISTLDQRCGKIAR